MALHLPAPDPADTLPAAAGTRRILAALLHGASHVLALLAQRLMYSPRRTTSPAIPPQLEFHAEAGAPEGALYADGVLVALLPGVNRL